MKHGLVTRRGFVTIVAGGVVSQGRLLAQGRGVFSYEKATTLSGTAEVVTIHLAAGSQRTVTFIAASVYCSVACTATIERNGVAPTATVGAPSGDWAGGSIVASAVPYYSSNVGSPTVGKTYSIDAGQERAINMTNVGLRAGQNITIRTSSITGNVRIFLEWREF